MWQKHNKQQGFTLIELLIALAIFAVIGVLVMVGLRSVLQTREHLQKTDENLREVITAVTVMRRDITAIVPRAIQDTSGSVLPALLIPSTSQFEFTRAGIPGPLSAVPHSDMQRVAYQFDRHKIYRITWPVLDRATKTVPVKRILLNNVQSMQLAFVDNKGQLRNVWSATSNKNAGFPRAVVISLTLKRLGKMTLVFAITGQQNDAQ